MEEKETKLAQIKDDLKKLLVDQLSLDDIEPGEIGDNDELFGEGGLDLDSLDAVEIVVLLQREFKIEVSDSEQSREVFQTISTLADYIYEKTK